MITVSILLLASKFLLGCNPATQCQPYTGWATRQYAFHDASYYQAMQSMMPYILDEHH